MITGLNFSDLTNALSATVRGNAGLVIGAVGGLTIGNVLLDRFTPAQASALIGNMAVFAAQVIVTRVATQRLGPEPLIPRVGGFFVLGLLGGIGVLAGLVFAIVPGLYLAARWLVAGPVLLVERDGVVAAMRRSWSITAPVAWPLSCLLLMLWVPAVLVAFGGGFLAGLFYSAGSETTDLAISAVAYFVMASASVASWLTAVATFGLLRPQVDTLADTFA